ncbi:PIN domain-containing protein [Halomarina oriensis]|uniref:PIN domain-containing protein n=1 Tax=Halomarina oriensis TaxID=671145 RepID=UPI001303C191|nr:PIN domain-containing protein [Halomarina oriensis]
MLDTDFIIDLMTRHEGAVALLNDIEASDEPQFVSSVTLFELYHSLARVDQPDERRQNIQAVLEDRPVLDADSDVMTTAGQLHGRLVADGNEVGPLDVIIGATGLVHGESVVTGNEADFERIFAAAEPPLAVGLTTYDK